MGKNKESKSAAVNGKKVETSKVKDAAPVAKPVEAVKTKSKSTKSEKPSKKVAKAPTPPESESESESDDAESDSDESEAETTSKTAKVNGAAKTNGVKAAESDSEADSDDSESDEETVPAAKANGVKAPAAAADSDSEADSDDSDSDDDAKPATNGAAAVKDDDDDDDSDDSEDSDEEVPAPKAASNKRKADASDEPSSKKAKTETDDGPKSVFVGNLSWGVDEDALREAFESFGEIIGCRIVTDRESGRSKGFGYVDYDSAAAAKKAVEEMKGADLGGRAINTDFSEPRKDKFDAGANPRDRAQGRAQQFGDAQSPPSDTLFIANLSFDTTAETLQENFSEYGTITRVSLPTHPDSGQLKGFGYIGFGSVDEATAALNAW